MKKPPINKLKLILITIAVINIIIITIFIVIKLLSIRPRIKITNLSDYTSKEENRNTEKEQLIEELLYTTAKLNSNEIDNNTTAIVREGTFKQYTKNYHHVVEFTADIEKLQQSYKVTYSWGINKDIKEDEWGTNIKCPQKEDLIYGDFNCTDEMINKYGTNDPIASILPVHETEQYYIYYDNEKSTVIIDLYGCRAEIIDEQMNKATEWLKKKVDNFEKYKVSYNYCVSEF